MSMYHRTTQAGALVVESIYPAQLPRDSTAVRQGKRALTTAAQQRANDKYAWNKLELEIAANFVPGDLYLTLTYDDAHLPKCRQDALNAIRAFWRRLRSARKAGGQDLRYIYVTEHKHGDGRWHHHVLVNATGDDYQQIRELWGQGLVDFRALRVDKDKHYGSLARYLCKELRDNVGQRLWSGSRNLRKPERDTRREPDSVKIKPPRNALVLEDSGDVRTAYGHYRVLKYILPGVLKRKSRPRARRRKH